MDDVWARLAALEEVRHPRKARAAVLVPLYEDGDDIRVVLTKRPDWMRTHPGDVVFPGGGMEDGEDPVATALREASEEVGLPETAVVEIIGGLTPVTTRNKNRPIVPVVARIERPDRFIPDPGEVDVIIEPTLDEMLVEHNWRRTDWFGHTMWFYEFEEGTLWGATAMMVRELLAFVR